MCTVKVSYKSEKVYFKLLNLSFAILWETHRSPIENARYLIVSMENDMKTHLCISPIFSAHTCVSKSKFVNK